MPTPTELVLSQAETAWSGTGINAQYLQHHLLTEHPSQNIQILRHLRVKLCQ